LSAHLFNVGNKMSAVLFESLKAEGTNLLIANGAAAGQKVDHLVLHVIPRYKDDGVTISWKSEQIKEEELKNVYGQIVSKTQGSQEPVKEVEEIKEVVEEPKETTLEDALEEETFDDERMP